MGVWPLLLVATKWLNSVSVVVYVYAPSTLACSLNIFYKKKIKKESGHELVELTGLARKKKRVSHGLAIFYLGQKIRVRGVQNKQI